MTQTEIIALSLGGALVLVILFAVFLLRRKNAFSPTHDKALQLARLNDDLETAGFAYSGKGDYFYARSDCWQREVGYCALYDRGSPFFNMIMDCEPIPFSYGGKRWLIQLWKGQYGITTGAEIGVYATAREDIVSEKFTGTFYEAISDEERLCMEFALRKNGEVLLRRRGLHWWLTAFKLGEFSEKDQLTMTAKITFPDTGFAAAFAKGLDSAGYEPYEYSLLGREVTVEFTKPHTPQPLTQEGLQEAIVQGINQGNCRLFEKLTAKYETGSDKLEYIKSMAPELYDFMLNSLYAEAFFASFPELSDLIRNPEETGGETDASNSAEAAKDL